MHKYRLHKFVPFYHFQCRAMERYVAVHVAVNIITRVRTLWGGGH